MLCHFFSSINFLLCINLVHFQKLACFATFVPLPTSIFVHLSEANLLLSLLFFGQLLFLYKLRSFLEASMLCHFWSLITFYLCTTLVNFQELACFATFVRRPTSLFVQTWFIFRSKLCHLFIFYLCTTLVNFQKLACVATFAPW